MSGNHHKTHVAREKQKFIENCKLCGSCLRKCRIHPFSAYADKDAAELQKARIEFLKGGEISQMIYDLTFACIGCHYCNDACEQGLDPSNIGLLSRFELIERGESAPPPYAFALPGERFNYFSILSALLLNPAQSRWMSKVPESPEHADVVYFPGCGQHVSPDQLFITLDILDRMEISYAALAGIEHCCGVPYVFAGQGEESSRYRDELIKAISAFTPQTAVLTCPGCTYRLAGRFLKPTVSFDVMHLSSFLGRNLERLKFEKEIKKTVTIHDPCKLGRGLGEVEGVRRVLKAIPGLRVVEMEHHGEDTLCCSGTAGLSNPKAAKALGLLLMEEAKQTGADYLVDLCLGCHRTFRGLSKGYPFAVISFVTLVGQALGIEHENKLSQYLQWKDVDRVIEDARSNIEASSYSEEEIRSFLGIFFSMM